MSNEKLNNVMVANSLVDNYEVAVDQEQTDETMELFEDYNPVENLSGANQLSKTARLTNVSTAIANEIMATILSDRETYGPQIIASQKSHDAMDDLINEVYEIKVDDYDFLKTVDSEEVDKMIRSQQSKRSRAKSKAMTKDNYLNMMIGAVAENLLRLAGGKPKSSGGGAVMGDIGFSPEDLDNLAQFPDELKKAIRNVQSKKSIYKAKANFDATSARWNQLLRAEQQLKEVRDRVNGIANEEAQQALQAKRQAEELLATTDFGEVAPDEAVTLLNQLKDLLAKN